MSEIKVVCVFGTRPEAIKMAPVVCALRARPEVFTARVCATAQHRDMLDQVLGLFEIVPDIDLNLMQPGQTPSQVAARVLERLEPVLQAERPDWILVQGDTTTVMAAAIAAHHLRIRIGHVEAGLRTGDKWNPFPEEMNRLVADHLSDLCFAPTERARQSLLREGIAEQVIRITGNTVVDALLWVTARPPTSEAMAIFEKLGIGTGSTPGSQVTRPTSPTSKLILVTAHRRESFGRPLEQICQALRQIAQRGEGQVQLVYPVHPNPNVQEPAHRLLAQIPNITLIPPADYATMAHLMKRSTLVLTDSGGIQEEAPSLGVPVLVLRELTERPEAVEAGVAKVVGTQTDRIVNETFRLLDDPQEYARMARPVNPYGDGHAAERIAQALLQRPL